jgi:hypothetical protein
MPDEVFEYPRPNLHERWRAPQILPKDINKDEVKAITHCDGRVETVLRIKDFAFIHKASILHVGMCGVS